MAESTRRRRSKGGLVLLVASSLFASTGCALLEIPQAAAPTPGTESHHQSSSSSKTSAIAQIIGILGGILLDVLLSTPASSASASTASMGPGGFEEPGYTGAASSANRAASNPVRRDPVPGADEDVPVPAARPAARADAEAAPEVAPAVEPETGGDATLTSVPVPAEEIQTDINTVGPTSEVKVADGGFPAQGTFA